MTKVHCMDTTCEYWKKGVSGDGLCGCDEIELDMDNMCSTYRAHVALTPAYRETFWKRMRSLKDGQECREAAQGKRYEMMGLVWFTDQDDRWGTDEIWFTEQQTGLRAQGRDICEDRIELILEKIRTVTPVMSLPEAALDDL